MTLRRDFLKTLGFALLPLPMIAAGRPAESLRDIETVRAGDPLAADVERVLLNERQMDCCTAFNVKEGWVDQWELDRTPIEQLRRYGKVSYTLRPE